MIGKVVGCAGCHPEKRCDFSFAIVIGSNMSEYDEEDPRPRYWHIISLLTGEFDFVHEGTLRHTETWKILT